MSFFKCQHIFYIYGPFVKKGHLRFLISCVLAEIWKKTEKRGHFWVSYIASILKVFRLNGENSCSLIFRHFLQFWAIGPMNLMNFVLAEWKCFRIICKISTSAWQTCFAIAWHALGGFLQINLNQFCLAITRWALMGISGIKGNDTDKSQIR